MITLCKFVLNDKQDSTNILVTKTFGKHGVLDREALAAIEPKPQHNEWWYCRVVKETGAGTAKGVWVLAPIRRVERIERGGFRDNDITHLFPPLFTTAKINNALILYPTKKGPNWICGNAMRKHFMVTNRRHGSYEINTIMVVFDNATDWSREPPGG